MSQTPRDQAICQAYLAGDSTVEIAGSHGISRARVEQIARANGLPHRHPDKRPGPATSARSSTHVTGEQLYEELRVAAAAARVSMQKFARPLFSEPNWKLEQLRIAKHPTQLTIERVRALVGGLPIPPSRGQYVRDPRAIGLSRAEAEEAGIPPSARSVNERALLDQQAASKARVELNRQLAELAHETRRPGQLLADRVRELRMECDA